MLIIDHNLGGGANLYRKQRVAEAIAAGRTVLLVYFDVKALDYIAEMIDADAKDQFVLRAPEDILGIAGMLKFDEIFVNELYSFDEPLKIVEILPTLRSRTGARLTLAIHDFFAVCPSYTLLNYAGTFCGIPAVEECHACLKRHNGDFTRFMRAPDIEDWRRKWREVLEAADTVLCFSNSTALLLCKAYPEINPSNVVIRPHRVDYAPTAVPQLDHAKPLHIGVVGTISYHKGAHIVRDLADEIARRRVPVRITVIGSLHCRITHDVVNVTGEYRREDLGSIIQRTGANLFLLPSICPETFSYVTDELMNLDVPLAVFNLGAPAERVSNYKHGLVLPITDSAPLLDALIAFHNRLAASTSVGQTVWELDEPSC